MVVSVPTIGHAHSSNQNMCNIVIRTVSHSLSWLLNHSWQACLIHAFYGRSKEYHPPNENAGGVLPSLGPLKLKSNCVHNHSQVFRSMQSRLGTCMTVIQCTCTCSYNTDTCTRLKRDTTFAWLLAGWDPAVNCWTDCPCMIIPVIPLIIIVHTRSSS